jgi:hypothetical protein
MRIKNCLSCYKEMINKRPHIKTCSSTCRVRIWRSSQKQHIPLKLLFTVRHFESLRLVANNLGLTVDALVMSRALGTPPTSS